MDYSMIEKEYIQQTRPYSQKELNNIRNGLLDSLNIGKVTAFHVSCGHFYFVKKNSRKEHKINTKNVLDVGNCSVCWKLNYTGNLINSYYRDCVPFPNYLYYDKIYIEFIFYKWLYEKI